jgi:hypothetical protein
MLLQIRYCQFISVGSTEALGESAHPAQSAILTRIAEIRLSRGKVLDALFQFCGRQTVANGTKDSGLRQDAEAN